MRILVNIKYDQFPSKKRSISDQCQECDRNATGIHAASEID